MILDVLDAVLMVVLKVVWVVLLVIGLLILLLVMLMDVNFCNCIGGGDDECVVGFDDCQVLV